MAAITSAVIGAASLGYGLYSRMEANDASEEAYQRQQQGSLIQAQAAQRMNAISKEQAASSVDYAGREYDINRQSSQDSLSASQQSQIINREITQLSQKVEVERKQAMEIDARRQNLEIIRNQQRARSLALSTSTAQGSSRGSGLQGGYAQIAGQTGFNLMGVQQSLNTGRNIFDLNSQITDQKLGMSSLEDQYALQRFNSQNQKAQLTYDYAQINAGYQTRLADAQTLSSQGQGVVNQGQGMLGMAQNDAAMANTFIGAAGTIAGMGQPLNNLYNNYSGSLSGWWNPASGQPGSYA